MKIAGVTKCPTGIAHTYMAAERLEVTGKKLGHEMYVETQGSQGTENVLTDREIEEADYVIIAADIAVDGTERFVGKKVFRTPIKPVLRDTEKIFRDMEEKAEVMAPAFPEEGRTPVFSFSAEKGREQSEMLRQLMNGASYMIPFVVVGGLFIALAQSFAGRVPLPVCLLIRYSGTRCIRSVIWLLN